MVKGKTDTNSYPFEEDKHLLCLCYPFECFKKTILKMPRELRFWPWLNLLIKLKPEASDHLAPKNSDTLRNFKLESFTC